MTAASLRMTFGSAAIVPMAQAALPGGSPTSRVKEKQIVSNEEHVALSLDVRESVEIICQITLHPNSSQYRLEKRGTCWTSPLQYFCAPLETL